MKIKNEIDLSNKTIVEQNRNTIIVLGFTLMNLLLAGAYLLEVIKGERSLTQYIIVAILTIIPTTTVIAMYFKKKESKGIRYVAMWSFLAFYTYIMITTEKLMTFCYIILMIILLTIYEEIRITLTCCIVSIMIILGALAKIYMSGQQAMTNSSEIEICLACMLLVTLYSSLVTKLNGKVKYAQLEKIDGEKEQTNQLLQVVLEVADSMEQSIVVLSDETNKLNESVETTKESMESLAEGASNTAMAIQTQQEKTAEINEHIYVLEGVTESIVSNVKTSEEIVEGNQTSMKQLLNQVEQSEGASNLVATQMTELKTYADQMQDIMALINNVASQTRLLALNASIEAARAGDAGRGFAVVAEQISNLASQTSSATGDIDVLIGEIIHSIGKVVDAVNNLLESNTLQNGYVNETAKGLQEINRLVENIFAESSRLDKMVATVSGANTVIVDTIQNVSASTEEITAKALETLESSSHDKLSVEKVLNIVEQLKVYADELNQSRQ